MRSSCLERSVLVISDLVKLFAKEGRVALVPQQARPTRRQGCTFASAEIYYAVYRLFGAVIHYICVEALQERGAVWTTGTCPQNVMYRQGKHASCS